jgi:hypothetical protein
MLVPLALLSVLMRCLDLIPAVPPLTRARFVGE